MECPPELSAAKPEARVVSSADTLPKVACSNAKGMIKGKGKARFLEGLLKMI